MEGNHSQAAQIIISQRTTILDLKLLPDTDILLILYDYSSMYQFIDEEFNYYSTIYSSNTISIYFIKKNISRLRKIFSI
ncbi:hypothetical protein DOY81_006386 [Sarcophaga bullata]|nr:hypothetical protein DOY81_006386 [Sarcophaga bullata]